MVADTKPRFYVTCCEQSWVVALRGSCDGHIPMFNPMSRKMCVCALLETCPSRDPPSPAPSRPSPARLRKRSPGQCESSLDERPCGVRVRVSGSHCDFFFKFGIEETCGHTPCAETALPPTGNF
eukprot:5940792-Prymnesium_polylepis.2